ncbi:hypothetical protein [Campylobacter sp. RM16188]|uniref:hypothetical protein n=1 Tax=Campylobacter sp. RM16188 TaxID=1705725 RepID=UPI001555F8E6|nr:hypothetical protein [Campylobacter sp. RM16188]
MICAIPTAIVATINAKILLLSEVAISKIPATTIATRKNHQKTSRKFLTINSILNLFGYLKQATLIRPKAIGATIMSAIVAKKKANCGVKEAMTITAKAKMQIEQIVTILYIKSSKFIFAPLFLFDYTKIQTKSK